MSRPGLLLAFVTALLGAACGGPTVQVIDDSLRVVHTSPHHGAIDVELSPTSLVGFTQGLRERSLEGAVKLYGEGDEGELAPLAIRSLLEDDGLVLLVVPRSALAPGRRHRLELLTGLESVSGSLLLAPFRTEFVSRR